MATLEFPRFEGLDPVFAQILGELKFGHERLTAYMNGLTPEQLLAKPQGFNNSIATLVVHIAGTEVGFAHMLQGQPFSEELKAEFLRDKPQNPLPEPEGETVESLTAKLEKSFGLAKACLQELTPDVLTREFPLGPERTATGAWLLSLLPFHLATHLGQIQVMKKLV